MIHAVSELEPFEFSSDHNKAEFLRDVLRCLELPEDSVFLPTNTTDASAHYHAILNYTLPYHRTRREAYRGCKGPFLEGEFIRRFATRPLTFFDPFVPLFMPWFALWKKLDFARYQRVINRLFDSLRPDYLYILLAESDFGVAGRQNTRVDIPNNILVLSPSGMGHVAVPWLQCHFKRPKSPRIRHFLSFCGNPRASGERKLVLETARAVFKNDFLEYRGPDWKRISQESLFGFSPRGIAVATYRTYELIRMETIPVIVTDAVHWLPYFPSLNWSQFSFLTDVTELPRTANRLRSIGPREIMAMKAALHNASIEYFQWDAFFRRLELFFQGGQSAFTCSKAALTNFI